MMNGGKARNRKSVIDNLVDQGIIKTQSNIQNFDKANPYRYNPITNTMSIVDPGAHIGAPIIQEPSN